LSHRSDCIFSHDIGHSYRSFCAIGLCAETPNKVECKHCKRREAGAAVVGSATLVRINIVKRSLWSRLRTKVGRAAHSAAALVRMRLVTRKLWEELHIRDWSNSAAEVNRQWLTDWSARVPNMVCGCRRKWLALVEVNPPPLAAPAAMRWWGFDMHNRVSLDMKPANRVMSSAEAIDRWHWPAD